jgi:hypothetical protein
MILESLHCFARWRGAVREEAEEDIVSWMSVRQDGCISVSQCR